MSGECYGCGHHIMDCICRYAGLPDDRPEPQAVGVEPGNDRDPYEDFRNELESAINRNNIDTRHDTPDFILAEFVVEVLRSSEHMRRALSVWNSDDVQKPTVQTDGRHA